MSRAELVWYVHANAEINGERGPGYLWEERALIQVDEALVRLRAEVDRTRALLPDLVPLVDSIVAEAHSARQFCIEDYVPEETTTSHFWQHLRKLRTVLTEFTRAAT
ncbi:hypothetical protein ABZS79_30355 [Streptomyces griseoloalbus]|uniref:hypothetical protein n=1 Tax=Streptomyces griseoloalbus TaxID=67303 RepID=UPI0033A60E24